MIGIYVIRSGLFRLHDGHVVSTSLSNCFWSTARWQRSVSPFLLVEKSTTFSVGRIGPFRCVRRCLVQCCDVYRRTIPVRFGKCDWQLYPHLPSTSHISPFSTSHDAIHSKAGDDDSSRSSKSRPRNEWTRHRRKGMNDTLMYITGLTVLFTGMAYAAVPLYRMFCAATGYAGTVKQGHGDAERMGSMQARKDRLIRVGFAANVNSNLTWDFEPQQTEIWVYPGETALAFFKATNPSDEPIVGISTYNIVPFDAGLYFNKVQCFCFEEQMLGPHETVDMPVFFYIDEDFCDDPNLEGVDDIILSYTFFKSKAGLQLPVPLRPEDREGRRAGIAPGGEMASPLPAVA